MTEKPIGERVAHIEGSLEQVLPAMQRMEDKLDKVLEGMEEKGSKSSVNSAHGRIDKVELALAEKADKKDLQQVRDKILLWTGGGVVIFALLSWFGPKLIALASK